MDLLEFADRQAASIAAAGALATRIESRLRADAHAGLVVSGGTTPVDCFRALAAMPLDWPKVDIYLSDERWIEPDSGDSNERLAREHLLAGAAAAARLVPVFAAGRSIEARCAELDAEIRALPAPFAAALLGMGNDGHFASLFPDADNLDRGLDPQAETRCLPVATAASPLQRVSLTLAALARSDAILVLIFGDDKRRVLEQAARGDGNYPAASLLALESTPVFVYWAP